MKIHRKNTILNVFTETADDFRPRFRFGGGPKGPLANRQEADLKSFLKADRSKSASPATIAKGIGEGKNLLVNRQQGGRH